MNALEQAKFLLEKHEELKKSSENAKYDLARRKSIKDAFLNESWRCEIELTAGGYSTTYRMNKQDGITADLFLEYLDNEIERAERKKNNADALLKGFLMQQGIN